MVIVIAHQKGGVGKSTITRLLACWLSLRNYKVAILDNDKQLHSAKWAKQRSENHPEKSKILYFKAEGNLTDAIKKAQGEAQVLIIDVAGSDESALDSAIPLADFVLMPSAPEPDCTDSIEHIAAKFDAVEESGQERPNGIVIWNKIASGLAYTWNEIEAESARIAALGLDALPTRRIVNRKAIRAAFEGGLTVLDDPIRDAKAAAEIGGLFEEIFDV